jgi:peptide/nickel transport system substrate-binding protein
MTGTARDFDGGVMGWVVGFEPDDTDLFHSDRIDEPLALSVTQNPEIDALLEELRLISDREVARDRFAAYQRLIVEEQPYTFVYFPDRLAGVNKRLRGVLMDARGEWINIKDWHLDPNSR